MRAAGLGLRDRVRSSNTCGELGPELLLFGVKRGQLRWLRPEFLWNASSWACPTGQEVDPELSGGTGYPIWPGNTWEPLVEKVGTPFLRYKNQVWKTLLFNSVLNEWRKIDGLLDGKHRVV